MSKRKKKQRNTEEGVVQPQPGEKLYEAREARGLSVIDVAVRLKLNVEKINALERGDIEGLAAPVFVAGYLRTYARLLDLSEAEVLADFDELLPSAEPIVEQALTANDEVYGKVASEISPQFSLREQSSGSWLGVAGFAGVVVLAMVYFLWPSNEIVRTNVAAVANVTDAHENTESPQSLPKTMPETMVMTTVMPTDEMMEVETNAGQAEEKQSSVEVLSAEPELNEVAVTVATIAAESTDMPKTVIDPVAIGMKSELALSFNSDSWAEVKDARGQRLVYRLGKSGSTRVVTGLAPFMVQLGYVQGVDILYNGAVYDLSKYANRRSVRLYIGEAGDRIGNE